MVILGIDPGTGATGYGVIETGDNLLRLLDFGCLRTSSREDMVYRLRMIYDKVTKVVEKFCPEEVAVEEVFFNQNAKTALSVGQARGVIILAVASQGAKVFSYTPLEVKQAITGYGRAPKEQVQRMVKKLLNLSFLPSPDDAGDAIAVALCHLFSRRLKKLSC